MGGEAEDSKLPVAFGKETLNLTYNRSKFTPKLEREINALADARQMGGMLSKMLMTILTSWDIVDVDPADVGKPENKQKLIPVPLTAETLDELISIEAQARIVKALTDAQRPDEEKLPDTNDSF